MDETLDGLEIKKKQKEIRKLEEEIITLKRNNSPKGRFIQFLPFLTALILLLGFMWTLITTAINYERDVSKQEKDLVAKIDQIEKESRGKIYEQQLKTYLDLSDTVSIISVTTDSKLRDEKYSHFQALYNGNLRIFEIDGNILKAAAKFEELYRKDPANKEKLQRGVRYLGCECKMWVKNLWGIPKDRELNPSNCKEQEAAVTDALGSP